MKKRKQIMIDPALEYRAEIYAKNTQQSFSSLVSEALVEYTADPVNFKKKKRKKSTVVDSLKRMLRDATDRGPSDLSTNDWYLYGPDIK